MGFSSVQTENSSIKRYTVFHGNMESTRNFPMGINTKIPFGNQVSDFLIRQVLALDAAAAGALATWSTSMAESASAVASSFDTPKRLSSLITAASSNL